VLHGSVSGVESLVVSEPSLERRFGGGEVLMRQSVSLAMSNQVNPRASEWFGFAKETDGRIDSTIASLDALRAGLATYLG